MKMHHASLSAFLVAAVCGCASLSAGADLKIPTAGRVTVELISSDAAYRNTLSVTSPNVAVAVTGCALEPAGGLSGTRLLSEKLSQVGCRVELDADPSTPGIQPFAADTSFTFNFCAQNNADAACEYIWSSDSSLNSDSVEHLQTTQVSAGVSAFMLRWEDMPGGGDADFNDLIVVVRVNADADGDGLWDDWETQGIDTNGDGTIDLDLPALGARPDHMDAFIEIDFMDCTVPGSDCAAGDTHSHRPKAAAVQAVVDAFAHAPNLNADGTTGINLHVDVSNAIAHQAALDLGLLRRFRLRYRETGSRQFRARQPAPLRLSLRHLRPPSGQQHQFRLRRAAGERLPRHARGVEHRVRNAGQQPGPEHRARGRRPGVRQRDLRRPGYDV
jgi:hypothetical protein